MRCPKCSEEIPDGKILPVLRGKALGELLGKSVEEERVPKFESKDTSNVIRTNINKRSILNLLLSVICCVMLLGCGSNSKDAKVSNDKKDSTPEDIYSIGTTESFSDIMQDESIVEEASLPDIPSTDQVDESVKDTQKEKKSESKTEKQAITDASDMGEESFADQPTETVVPNQMIDNILTPDIVQKLSAGSILMTESIDWDVIDDYFVIYDITEGDAVYNRIIGNSYIPNDNISLADLRYLKLLHYNFEGNLQVGELICNAALAEDMIDIFRELLQCEYQICSMHLIDDYWTGDGIESDEASIEVDNTSCFCYRKATDADNLSNHAYGRAIDLNPLENPFYLIREDGSLEYYHTNAEPYLLDRDPSVPHVITEVDDAYRIFTEHGFSWGGSWSNPKDYQHFEKLT